MADRKAESLHSSIGLLGISAGRGQVFLAREDGVGTSFHGHPPLQRGLTSLFILHLRSLGKTFRSRDPCAYLSSQQNICLGFKVLA